MAHVSRRLETHHEEDAAELLTVDDARPVRVPRLEHLRQLPLVLYEEFDERRMVVGHAAVFELRGLLRFLPLPPLRRANRLHGRHGDPRSRAPRAQPLCERVKQAFWAYARPVKPPKSHEISGSGADTQTF